MEYWSVGVMRQQLPESNPILQYSITPLLHLHRLLLPLQKLQAHPFRPFEKTNPSAIWQHALFEDFYPGGFDLGDFAVEVIGVNGDVLKAVKLAQFLFGEKLSDVQLHAMQVETIVFAAIGPCVFLDDFRSRVLDIEIRRFLWIRRFEVKMVDSKSHCGILLTAICCRFYSS